LVRGVMLVEWAEMPNNSCMSAAPSSLPSDWTQSRGSTHLQIVRTFSAARPDAWLELCVHVVAMANSGGGMIVVVGHDALEAELQRLLAQHLGESFTGFAVRVEPRDQTPVGVIDVTAREGSPLVFDVDGTYTSADGKTATVFHRGTVYVRHGRRSDAARSKDIARLVNREVDRQRRALQRNVRKASTAPKGAEVLIVSAREPTLFPTVRVVDDPRAPTLARTDFDVTHPFRQKELVATLNARAGGIHITAYDIQCVRRVHHIDDHPEFFHQPKFGSPQYSEAYVEWLLSELARDPQFFEDAKVRDREQRLARAQSDAPADG
jgi:hypothetical protein